jgi:hypothetical protein
MKLHIFILISILVLTAYSFSAYALLFEMYNIKANIIDENGAPVEDADVYISFEKNTTSGTKMFASKRITDSTGKFEASGSGNGHISYGATKVGYYQSHYTYDFPSQKENTLQNREFNIVLRKIENQVPMYARRIRKEIPFAKMEIGFDLIKSDWVVPYGQGQLADINVYLETDETGVNDFEYKVRITFNGKFNGYYKYDENIRVGSIFKLPRYAQLNGYDNSMNVFWRGLKRGSKISWDSNRHYIYRVRSEEENGKFIKAMYGKIFSDIELRSNRKTGGLPSIEFIYYLNPDYTRNLEFDPKRNLFGILPDRERVTEP